MCEFIWLTLYQLKKSRSLAHDMKKIWYDGRSSFFISSAVEKSLAWICCARDRVVTTIKVGFSCGAHATKIHIPNNFNTPKINSPGWLMSVFYATFVLSGKVCCQATRKGARPFSLPLLSAAQTRACMNEEAKGKNIFASRNWLLHNKSRLKDFLLQLASWLSSQNM